MSDPDPPDPDDDGTGPWHDRRAYPRVRLRPARGACLACGQAGNVTATHDGASFPLCGSCLATAQALVLDCPRDLSAREVVRICARAVHRGGGYGYN